MTSESLRSCAYCLGPSPGASRCETCGAAQHPDCWQESGGCAVAGCEGTTLAQTAPTAPTAPDPGPPAALPDRTPPPTFPAPPWGPATSPAAPWGPPTSPAAPWDEVTWPTPAVAAFDEQTTATLSASARPPEAVLETPAEPNRPRRRRSLVLAAFLAAGILGGATTFTAFSLLPDSGTTVALTPPATISQTETGPEPEPAATPERAPAAPAADPADVRVQVLDGAGSEARIDAAVAALEDLGYRVTAGQAALPFNTTTVYYGDDTRDAATALRDADTRFTRILARQPGFDDTYDVHVVVGTDWPLPPGQEDLAAAPTGIPDAAAAPAPPAAAPPAAVPAAPAPPGSYGTATLQVPGWVAILDSVFPDGTLPATDLPRQGPFAYADVLGYAGNFERAGIATTVFNSSTYSSLRPGLWVIAVPGFASGDAAEGYCATVAAVAPDCYPRYVDY